MTAPAIDVNDLVDQYRIIELAINKGSFNAAELKKVMPVFVKLETVLEGFHNQNQQTESNDSKE